MTGAIITMEVPTILITSVRPLYSFPHPFLLLMHEHDIVHSFYVSAITAYLSPLVLITINLFLETYRDSSFCSDFGERQYRTT